MSTTGRPATGTDELIAVFERADAPVLTAPEIAEELGVTRQAINYRLQQLAEEDIVARKQIGSRAVAWWLRQSAE